VSYSMLEDSYPGRCLNHRASVDAWGEPTSVRCLGYEGEQHVCIFPDPPERLSQSLSGAQSFVASRPRPWESPTHERSE
jgi:hypothetical protein